jgi:tetratricopeptide (TPR) repeat protein
MRNRFRLSSILTVLAVSVAVSSAWAGDAFIQGDAARALQRAEGLLQQRQYQKAAAEFERASALAGGACPECLLGVGRAYRGAGQLDAALQVTRMGLGLLSSPADRARGYNQLGSLLALKGDMDAAQEAFHKAVELDGSMESQVRSTMADALLKRAADAEAAARKSEAEEASFSGKGSGAP